MLLSVCSSPFPFFFLEHNFIETLDSSFSAGIVLVKCHSDQPVLKSSWTILTPPEPKLLNAENFKFFSTVGHIFNHLTLPTQKNRFNVQTLSQHIWRDAHSLKSHFPLQPVNYISDISSPPDRQYLDRKSKEPN